MYQAEEKDFHQLHEFIIRQSGKYSALSCQPNYGKTSKIITNSYPVPTVLFSGIIISLKTLHGELNQIKEDNPLLFKNISLTNKLGFPDVIMPGDVRNDLYLILEKGEFERGGKSTGKNIEVTILVLDCEKNIIKVHNCCCGIPTSSDVSTAVAAIFGWNLTKRQTTSRFENAKNICRIAGGGLVEWKDRQNIIP